MSFSFEQALVTKVYLTTLGPEPDRIHVHHRRDDDAIGPFRRTVVSMRPMTAINAIRSVEITSRFPHTRRLNPLRRSGTDRYQRHLQTRLGRCAGIPDNQIPVFGPAALPQNAIRMAKPEICITHTPGSMLITDLPAHGNAAQGLRLTAPSSHASLSKATFSPKPVSISTIFQLSVVDELRQPERQIRENEQKRDQKEHAEQERHRTIADVIEISTSGPDPMHHIEIDADRRRNQRGFHQYRNHDPKPNRIEPQVNDNGKDHGDRG